MEKRIWPRALLLGLLAVLAVAYLLPSLVGKDNLPNWFTRSFDKQILKGLDLAGGLYLEYHVDLDEAIEDKMERIGDDIRSEMVKRLRGDYKRGKDDMLEDVLKVDADGNEAVITLAGAHKSKISMVDGIAEKLGYRETRNPTISEPSVSKSAGKATLRMDPDHVKKIEEEALAQAKQTIQGRVDEFGVSGADVMRREDAIIVELPGLDRAYIKRVKDKLGKAAKLEFKIVDDVSGNFRKMASLVFALQDKKRRANLPEEVVSIFMSKKSSSWKWRPVWSELSKVSVPVGDRYQREGKEVYEIYLEFPKSTKDTVLNFVRKIKQTPALEPYRIPADREVAFGPLESKKKKGYLRSYFLHRIAGVTGEYLDDASVGYDEQNRPIVQFRFGRAGEKKFRELTRKNIKRRMAIILDDVVKSAPVIQSEIGARGQISLGSMRSRAELQQEAKDLSSILKAGSLPAPMSLEFEQQVGPKLGQQAIALGTMALSIGAVLVILFMMVYYRASGIIAIVALSLNVLFILAILAAVEARLTLPGIAGIVLTVGMAVDANVIIFERIREELRLGKTPRAAIDAGYGRAFWTIIDAQVTTAIAGFVLMQYGSGPIKGFAVTLLIGIICSVYTGVFVTRIMFDLITKRGKLEQLSI